MASGAQPRLKGVVPGTGATSLGKAIDSAAGATDTGIAPLAVRDDALSGLTPAEGDYVPLRVDGNGNLWVQVGAALPAGTNLIGKVQPFSAVLETGLVELVGTDEQVDQNDYGGSVAVALGGTYSGEILAATFVSTGGDEIQAQGRLLILDADPAVAVGDTALSAAEHGTIVGIIGIGSSDTYHADAGGASIHKTVSIPFHALSSLYLVWFLTSATSINSDAGDNEVFSVNLWYRRDS
jgi:hypothetical protein